MSKLYIIILAISMLTSCMSPSQFDKTESQRANSRSRNGVLEVYKPTYKYKKITKENLKLWIDGVSDDKMKNEYFYIPDYENKSDTINKIFLIPKKPMNPFKLEIPYDFFILNLYDLSNEQKISIIKNGIWKVELNNLYTCIYALNEKEIRDYLADLVINSLNMKQLLEIFNSMSEYREMVDNRFYSLIKTNSDLYKYKELFQFGEHIKEVEKRIKEIQENNKNKKDLEDKEYKQKIELERKNLNNSKRKELLKELEDGKVNLKKIIYNYDILTIEKEAKKDLLKDASGYELKNKLKKDIEKLNEELGRLGLSKEILENRISYLEDLLQK